MENEEREAVERASQVERQLYCVLNLYIALLFLQNNWDPKVERQQFLSVAQALQPVLEQQAVLGCNHLASTSNLSDLITSLADMTEERKTATAELDSMIRLIDIILTSQPYHCFPTARDLRSAAPGYSFTTPPPSPATSLQGSRRGSISSIGSSSSSLQRPTLSSLATSPSPHLTSTSRPRPSLQRSLSHASDRVSLL